MKIKLDNKFKLLTEDIQISWDPHKHVRSAITIELQSIRKMKFISVEPQEDGRITYSNRTNR